MFGHRRSFLVTVVSADRVTPQRLPSELILKVEPGLRDVSSGQAVYCWQVGRSLTLALLYAFATFSKVTFDLGAASHLSPSRPFIKTKQVSTAFTIYCVVLYTAAPPLRAEP